MGSVPRSGRSASAWRRLLLLGAGFVLMSGAATVAAAAVDADAGLDLLRSRRREGVRRAVVAAAEQGAAAPFGLLVVPVDFADARLPAGWNPAIEIGPRLFPVDDPASLAAYYAAASGSRSRLEILLAPVVHLPGTRRDYSDLDLNGFTRTRRLAAESIEAVAATGVDFRLLDIDGPDGAPGSGDDDGEVDGVLILHAAPGIENDPEDGLVMPLAFYLDEPVFQRGVAASSYAVASISSGLGIWAHETGHLFGLDDRYDPYFPVAGNDLAGRGGLGIFSLMAAGAWGEGEALRPSLPDAYSCARLGWLDVADWPGSASGMLLEPSSVSRRAWRVWEPGIDEPEYFLMEVRGGVAPYDPLLPEPQLLVYHIDESVPEGAQSSTVPEDRHLRVRLVEADGDGALAAAIDRGGDADTFPGSLGVDSWTPTTDPSTAGYERLTEIRLISISATAAGVTVAGSVLDGPRFDLDFGFGAAADTLLELAARAYGPEPAVLTATVAVTTPATGTFLEGDSVELELLRDSGGAWRPVDSPRWIPDPAADPETLTEFRIVLNADGEAAGIENRLWLWSDILDPLDFVVSWPGVWTVRNDGDPGTDWHRWPADGGYELVCTDAAATAPGVVDQPVYANGSDVTLVSGWFRPGGRSLRLVHRIRVAGTGVGEGPDGAVVEIEDASGLVAALEPRGGYPQAVDAGSRGALHGRGAFVGDAEDGAGPWRIDVFDLPADASPRRLRLRLASDRAWRDFGWAIRVIELLSAADAYDAFAAGLVADPADDILGWTWPWGQVSDFAIDASEDGGESWVEIWTGGGEQGMQGYQRTMPLASIGPLPAANSRRSLRVRALGAEAVEVACRPVSWHVDGGPGEPVLFAAPWPNPARDGVRLLIDRPDGAGEGRLSVYDVRGRRLRAWRVGVGSILIDWDGRDGDGRLLAGGTYLLRLETPEGEIFRKVVILR